jgi:antitoxin HicB
MTEKSIEYYMSLPYRVEIYPEPDGSGYTALIPELPGCMTCADTIEELWNMIEEAKRGWLEISLEDGDYVPEPAPVEVEEYSGKFVVRLPMSLHQQLAGRAELEKTSLNQLVVMLLADGMGRWSARPRFGIVRPRPEQAIKPFQRSAFEEMRRSLGTREVERSGEVSVSEWQDVISLQTPRVVA